MDGSAVACAELLTPEQLQKLKTDPVLRELCGELAVEERALLEASIAEHGVLCPIFVWRSNGIILDGYNRREIAVALGRDCPVQYVDLPHRDDAKLFALNQQLGRRNLTDERRSYARGVRTELIRKLRGTTELASDEGEQCNGCTVPSDGGRDGGPREGVPSLAQVAAEEGVCRRTLFNDAAFAQAVDAIGDVCPQAKLGILDGRFKATRAALAELAAEESLCQVICHQWLHDYVPGWNADDAIAELQAEERRLGLDKSAEEIAAEDERERANEEFIEEAEAKLREVGALDPPTKKHGEPATDAAGVPTLPVVPYPHTAPDQAILTALHALVTQLHAAADDRLRLRMIGVLSKILEDWGY